jgi:hypothetical protein
MLGMLNKMTWLNDMAQPCHHRVNFHLVELYLVKLPNRIFIIILIRHDPFHARPIAPSH